MIRMLVSLALLVLIAPLAARADVIDVAPLKDNTLYENATGARSNGAGSYLFAGVTDQPALRRAVIAFDVAAAVPVGATISSVTLTMNMSRTISGAHTVSLHPVMCDWGEGTSDATGEEGRGASSTPGDATWIHAIYDTLMWVTPGGDFLAPSGSTSVAGEGSYTWDSTREMVADVQAWLDDPAGNYGWMILGDEAVTGSAKRFDSRENTATAPMLTIEYATGGSPGPTVYESTDPSLIVDALNAVGTAESSPFDHTPDLAPVVYYQVEDDLGLPALINIVKGGSGIQIHF